MPENEEVKPDTNTNESEVKVTPQRRYTTFLRVCDNPRCGKDFTATQATQRFCSDSCRSAGRSKRNPSPSSAPETDKKSILPTPTITGLPPHLQMAFDILKENSKRYEKWFEEEKAQRKLVEEEKNKLILQIRDIEQKQVLDGIEESKPSMLGKIFNEIPPTILEQLAPALGVLANNFVAKISPSIAGTDGQLDEAQTTLLAWISSLPEPLQQNLMGIIGTLMQLPEDKLTQAITGMLNLLTGGKSMYAQPNQSMYGVG